MPSPDVDESAAVQVFVVNPVLKVPRTGYAVGQVAEQFGALRDGCQMFVVNPT